MRITWAVYDQGYIVAVEIDDYNGDKIKAGTYSADVVHSSDGKNEWYDRYIEKWKNPSRSTSSSRRSGSVQRRSAVIRDSSSRPSVAS